MGKTVNEYRIQADYGKELVISRWPDGRYSIKVFSSLGQMVAHLITPKEEGEKLTDALNNLRHEVEGMRLEAESQHIINILRKNRGIRRR